MSIKWCALILCGLVTFSTHAAVDLVKVDKSKRRMYLMEDGIILKEYRIALGANPKGHKQEEGDNRTPEGSYTLDYVIEDSAFYRSVHISYPDAIDTLEAHRRGVSPGGNIKIHGLRMVRRKILVLFRVLIGPTGVLRSPMKKWMNSSSLSPWEHRSRSSGRTRYPTGALKGYCIKRFGWSLKMPSNCGRCLSLFGLLTV